MIKIYLPSTSNDKHSQSGGFQFLNNLRNGIERNGMMFVVVDTWQECDIVLITGVTMTNREEMLLAKNNGKKIVLRVDNMPKDSRNRGTAFSRMKDFASIADHIIYQSEWAKDYVGHWIHKFKMVPSESVIYNGVDTDIFFYKDNPEERDEVYLFSQFNRDENKRFPEAAYYFHKIARENSDVSLFLVGQFSDELRDSNFDFFDDENVYYQGVFTDRYDLAQMMRQCKYLLCPYFADASPNTISEAMACGLKILLVNPVGGSQEVIENNKTEIYTLDEMIKAYCEVFSSLIN